MIWFYKAKILIIICIIASIEAKAQNENILIGLNSPAYGVSIKTNFNSTGLAGWARGFSISNEDLTEKFISFSAKGTTDQNGSSFDYGYIGRKYNDTFMVFRPNGNIGIGTTTPYAPLVIAKTPSFKEGMEIATFREDIGKGRRPDAVNFSTIDKDVLRRDLTINALFYDIEKKEVVDLVGGIADIQSNSIRTVGRAQERFEEDPLRKLRALRFQASTGGKLDKQLHDALQSDPSLKGVSAERIRDEFVKSIKKAKNPSDYLNMSDKLGFTQQILPNLKVSKPYPNNNDYILF